MQRVNKSAPVKTFTGYKNNSGRSLCSARYMAGNIASGMVSNFLGVDPRTLTPCNGCECDVVASAEFLTVLESRRKPSGGNQWKMTEFESVGGYSDGSGKPSFKADPVVERFPQEPAKPSRPRRPLQIAVEAPSDEATAAALSVIDGASQTASEATIRRRTKKRRR